MVVLAGGSAWSATAPATSSRAASPLGAGVTIAAGHDIAVIPIEGTIYPYTPESLKQRVEQAISDGATMIVLELDTPGGYVDSALEISRYLKNLSGRVQTVAWVNDSAYSAGILIAAACDEIIMAPASATGDCAVIMPGQNLAPTERAKAYSPIRTEFEDSARRNGYDFPMFDAMCRLGVELYVVEHQTTGQRRVVNQADFDIMVRGNAPPITAIGNAAVNPSIGDVRFYVADPAKDTGKWSAVTSLAGMNLPGGRLHDGTSLFTPDQTTAGAIGLSKAIAGTPAQVQQHYQAASINRYQRSWLSLVAWGLTRPWVVGLLVLVMVVMGFWELSAPGLGLPGILAVGALVLLVGAPMLVGLGNWWEVLLVAVGVALLIVEMFILPGFGFFGVAGVVSVFAGLALLGVPALTQGQGPVQYAQPQAWRQLVVSGSVLGAAFLAALVGLIFMAKHTGQIPGLGRMVLSYDESGRGATAAAALESEPRVGEAWQNPPMTVAVGDTGTVVSTLRPTGRVRFEGLVDDVDVVSNGGYLEAGKTARVIEVAGNRVVVERA